MTNLRRATARALVIALLAIQGPPASAPPPARAAEQPAACPDERPDAGAARSTAASCGKRIEITGLASETTRVWANPDGTLTADVTAGPSRVRLGHRWVDTDLRLRRTADGSVEPVAHPRGLRLSGRRADGTHALATVAAGDDSLALQWTGALPEPRLDGSRATYPDARPGVDLVVEATSTGFEQFLVVKHRAAATHAATLALPLVSRSLTLVDQGQGALGVVDAGGRVVGRVPAPRMWDGTRTREKAVGMTATGRPGRADLALHADRAWLDDPATTYPVTIDPSVTINPTGDTYVKQGVTIDHSGATDLQLGYSGGIARSFLQWPTAAFAHGRITSATLKFWNFWSGSCAAAAWEIWTAAPYTNPITWPTQPALLVREGASSETKGFDASCDDNWVGVDATSFFRRAADSGADKAHMGLKAANETSSWKQFRSMQGGAAVMPRVTITYWAAPRATTPTTSPATGDCATGAGRPYTSSRTPQLSATVADEDSATVSAVFEWWSTGGAKIGGATASAAAGSTAAVTVPSGAFADGGTYSWRVQASDGTNVTPWSPWCEVTVDSTAPSGAPTVTSTAFPEGIWSGGAGREGAVSFGAPGASDVVAYRYGLDTNPPTETIAADVPGGGATATLTPASDGPHTLFVRSADRAGNLSPIRAYTFYVGTAAVLSPEDGDVTPGTTSLQGQAPSGATGVTYQWRRADVDDWRTVPTSDVAVATGGGVTWPAPTTADGTTTKLNWDVARTVGAVDGPVQVRAVFTGGGTSSPVHFTVDRDRGTAARTDVGPGSVNLLSGDFSVSHTDVAAGSTVGVDRTYSTRQAGGVDPVFGPGWVSGTAVGTGHTALTVVDSLVRVEQTRGDPLVFARTGDTTFAPQPGAEGMVLTYRATGDTFALHDGGGTEVVFGRPAGGPAGQYVPTAATATGSARTTTYSWERVTVDGKDLLRPTRVLAPVPAGVSCAADLGRGCRALDFGYATTTTATPGTHGDYAGRANRVSLTAWDPDAGRMATVVLARYAYDDAGRLRQAWDPRLDWTEGSTTRHVAHTYDYGANGLLSAMTPPGQAPWQLAYTTVPGDGGAGRLASVSRTGPAGEARTTVVYRVPVTAPHDLSAAQTRRWGQAESPVAATAVFPPSQVPDGDQAAGVQPGSFAHATTTYLDANGRVVNTVTPGGHTTTTWYDARGDAVRGLTATNRAAALAAGGDTAATALRLSTLNTYTDTKLPLEVLEPEHTVRLADGRTVQGRNRTLTTYDEGAPEGAGAGLPTTTRKGVRFTDTSGAVVDADVRVTATRYDWALKAATEQVTDPNGLALTTRNGYDPTGRPVSRTLPGGDTTTTPKTRLTVHYRSDGGSGQAECDHRPEWVDLVCQVRPGGQPASGPEVPVTTTTYDLYQQPRTVTERTSAGVVRTTERVYDRAGRLSTVAITGAGTPVPTTRTTYDQATGLLAQTQSVDASGAVTASVARGYDTLGQVESYVDSTGNVTRTSHDTSGRVSTVDDGKAVRTYGYDERGLPTTVQDSRAGTSTAAYDPDGEVVEETWPTGVRVTRTLNGGVPVELRYVQPDCGRADCTLYAERTTLNAHDQRAVTVSTFSTETHAFDGAGRITSDTTTIGGTCTSRSYGLDRDANRTSLTVFGPGAVCQTTTASSTRTWTYDTADRVTSAGYDALGRTTTVPAADSTGSELTTSFHTNDMVRSIIQSGRTATYTLDPLGNRVASWTDGTTTRVNHFGGDTDSPAWTDEGGDTVTRPVLGVRGPVAIWSSASGVTWQITSLTGDFVAGLTGGTPGLAFTGTFDHHGQPRSATDVGTRRYGWHGARERAADNPGGLVLLGVRAYNPTTSRFLSVDPVYGGSANPYDYCSADAANCADANGHGECSKHWIFTLCGIVINVGWNPVKIGHERSSKHGPPNCGRAGNCRWLYSGQSSRRYWRDTDSYRVFGSWRVVRDGQVVFVYLPPWGWS